MDKHLYSNQNNEDQNQNMNEVPPNKDKQKQQKSHLSNLLSGIVGGVIATILVVFLFINNLIPTQQQEVGSSVQTEGKEELPISELMADNDFTPPSISELSKAIVGIINLKQQNVWTPNQEAGTGSGIIYNVEDDQAYIVTNNHVVDGASEVEVELNNEERVKAKVLGADPLTDLAVLAIDNTHIEYVAPLGSSDDLQIGETVLAIGNPLSMEFSGSVTKGIISGLDRALKVDTNGDGHPDWITEVIQTDAAINPGNSGGALVSSDGKVIGINSMKIARQSVEGIGFAIPINSALPIMNQLEESGEISRPFIGITAAEISQVPFQYQHKIELPEDIESGMVIADVQQDSPAANAGLQQFDVITKINEHEITSLLDLRRYMYAETSVGDTIDLEIFRDGQKQIIQLKLTEQPIE